MLRGLFLEKRELVQKDYFLDYKVNLNEPIHDLIICSCLSI